MNQETTHYRKVLISEEGPPKESGSYETNLGTSRFQNGVWSQFKRETGWYGINIKWWYDPYSPKEEAVRFAGWLSSWEKLNNGNYMIFYSTKLRETTIEDAFDVFLNDR